MPAACASSCPRPRTVIDIGGQDSKLIWLGEEAVVSEFAMNDRCAAGTGRFLEVLAVRLGVRLDCLGELAGRSREPAAISSMCVVFAETEIIGLLASGAAAGGHRGGRAGLDCHAGGGDGRSRDAAAGRLHRRRGVGAGHGRRARRSAG